jgi:hypothetical protein
VTLSDGQIAKAVATTTADLILVGVTTSERVVDQAAHAIKQGRVASPRSALLYPVRSSEGARVYHVVLSFDDQGMISSWRCDCEAGREYRTCHHALAALSLAHHDGYEVAT